MIVRGMAEEDMGSNLFFNGRYNSMLFPIWEELFWIEQKM